MEITNKDQDTLLYGGLRLRIAVGVALFPLTVMAGSLFLLDLARNGFPWIEFIGKSFVVVFSAHLLFFAKLYSSRVGPLRNKTITGFLSRLLDQKTVTAISNNWKRNSIIAWCYILMLLLETVLFGKGTAVFFGGLLGGVLAIWAEIYQECTGDTFGSGNG